MVNKKVNKSEMSQGIASLITPYNQMFESVQDNFWKNLDKMSSEAFLIF